MFVPCASDTTVAMCFRNNRDASRRLHPIQSLCHVLRTQPMQCLLCLVLQNVCGQTRMQLGPAIPLRHCVIFFSTGFWCYIGDCLLQALLDSCLRTHTRNGLNGQVTPTHFFNNSCTETGGFRTVYQTVTSFPLQIDAHMT